LGHVVYPPKADIVSGGFVIWPWVAQADKQFDHGAMMRDG